MLVDSHSHLDAAEFDDDRPAVLARAAAAGVARHILCATDMHQWTKMHSVCAGAPGLHAAYGLHPTFLSLHRPEHIERLRERLSRERPVAVGECGLDYFVEGLDRGAQMDYFGAQLRLAREFDLPVVIHARRAVDAVIAAIRRIGGLRGVVHSFPGSRQQADQLFEQGFMLGFGGPVTYERAQRLRRLVVEIPLEWMLLETDSPDQPDAGIRGQRNEPARLLQVLRTIAELREADPAAIAAATSANAERLFGLPSA